MPRLFPSREQLRQHLFEPDDVLNLEWLDLRVQQGAKRFRVGGHDDAFHKTIVLEDQLESMRVATHERRAKSLGRAVTICGLGIADFEREHPQEVVRVEGTLFREARCREEVEQDVEVE